jgi:type IV pilus assembly protein PilX
MRHPLRKQRGAALVVALILLVVATLIGLASSRDTVLQERMSSNSYDRSLAFQRAEAALRFGEERILNETWQITGLGGVDCSATACGVVPADTFTGTSAFWQNVPAAFDVNDAATPGVPQYHIVFLGTGPAEPPLGQGNAANADLANAPPPLEMAYYRITGRSSDPTPATLGGRSVVILQSTTRRTF